MTTRTDAYIQASLDLIYRNTNFAGVGDATGVRGSVSPPAPAKNIKGLLLNIIAGKTNPQQNNVNNIFRFFGNT